MRFVNGSNDTNSDSLVDMSQTLSIVEDIERHIILPPAAPSTVPVAGQPPKTKRCQQLRQRQSTGVKFHAATPSKETLPSPTLDR